MSNEAANISLSVPRETAEHLLEATAAGSPAQLIGVVQIEAPDPVQTSREDREILRMLAGDFSIQRIAKRLGRAESTVQLRLG